MENKNQHCRQFQKPIKMENCRNSSKRHKKNVLVFKIFHFKIYWLLELFRTVPFYLLAFGTVPTVLVFVFHFIYWLLELFRQCWFLFSILFIGFWNCSDSCGFYFHFIYWLLELCPTVLVFIFHFFYWLLELFR